MKLYADTPVRRSRQIVADLFVVAWIVGWVWVALVVHDGTMALAAPGRQVESSAVGMADGLAEAGDFLDRVPVVGDGVSAPFDKASSASESLAEAGRSQVRAVERLAFWLGLSVALIPVLVVLAVFLPLRLRFVREATRRGTVHRRERGPGPVRAAGAVASADARPGQDLRRPCRCLAAARHRRRPRAGRPGAA